MVIGEGPEEHGVDHREYRRGCPDTEGEGERCRDGVSGSAPQPAQGVTDLFRDGGHELSTLSHVLLRPSLGSGYSSEPPLLDLARGVACNEHVPRKRIGHLRL